jgi:formylglycine-generating enzyme required for sulfatase activity
MECGICNACISWFISVSWITVKSGKQIRFSFFRKRLTANLMYYVLYEILRRGEACMKKRFGLLMMGFVFCGAEMGVAQGDGTAAPALRVVCKPVNAKVQFKGRLPSGEDRIQADGKPVVLKEGEQYTLLVTAPGYVPYRIAFPAAWSGTREKSVVLERGIGPMEGESWTADLEDNVEMEFMPVPAGHFMMGSNDGEEDELPVRRVEFQRPFWMAKTEVTNQQYNQFREIFTAEGTAQKNNTLEKNEVPMPRGAENPVCYISWTDAMNFCKWLTKKERRRGRLPEGYEYTLPTEAEWEYACRAGTTGDYAGDVDAMAWHKGNSAERTNPVGLKKPNAWGLHDMHGNVWEWCVDNWYASYANAPVDGSQRGDAYNEYEVDRSLINKGGNIYRLQSSLHRVVRGGCWSYSAMDCRSANRYYHTPDFKLNYLGFRPVVLWNPPDTKVRATSRLKERPGIDRVK